MNKRWRSKYVVWGSVGTLLAGCCASGIFFGEDRRCVDSKMNVIDDDNCRSGGSGRWYYGGSSSSGKVSGGSFERAGFGGKGGGGS